METVPHPSESVARYAYSASQVQLPRKVLIFDSDDRSCSVISEALSHEQFDLIYAQDPSDVRARVSATCRSAVADRFHLLIWGLQEPLAENLRTLHEICGLSADLRVVLLVDLQFPSVGPILQESKVEAVVRKPFQAHELKEGIARAISKGDLNFNVRAPIGVTANLHSKDKSQSRISTAAGTDGRALGLIGSSSGIIKVIELVHRVGPSSVNVLITGESGTGKEMVARAIHRVSDRADKPFIAINCAAIPRELLESELFGHAKGAFTGATVARRGLFEEAHEGTILLDEIGDLPLSLQAKILRLLQTKQVKPLGQNSVREVNVRIISATHKHLKSLIQSGEFREDLYYRLNVMPIHLPPLRERKDDILLLAEHFLTRNTKDKKIAHRALTRSAQAKLLSLAWRGNVRELENVIERAIVLAEGDCITDAEIMVEDLEPTKVTTEDLFNSGLTLKDIEREYIKYVLTRTGHRKEAATRILGIDRKTLYRKEKLFGIR